MQAILTADKASCLTYLSVYVNNYITSTYTYSQRPKNAKQSDSCDVCLEKHVMPATSPCSTFPCSALQLCQMCHLAAECPGNWVCTSGDICKSMKMLAASHQKCPNCQLGTTWLRIKLCSSAEIIILLRSSAVQAAKEIYGIITQPKDNQALCLEHTEFQKVPSLKKEKKKICQGCPW